MQNSGKNRCSAPNTHFSQSICMASEAGRFIYSWNSSKWELLAALPQSPGWYPQHQEYFSSIADEISIISLASVCSAVLPLSFPPLEVWSSA